MNAYNHTQDAASAEWVITHNLNTYPVSDVVIIEGDNAFKVLPLTVEYTDANTLTVRFSAPRRGFARLVGNEAYAKLGSVVKPPVAPVEDEYWEAVSSLVHFDGDGTAERGSNVTLSPAATMSTDEARFGTTSLYVNGSSASYASLPASPETAFGTGDYTVEMFINPTFDTGVGKYQGLFYRRSGGSSGFVLALADEKLSFWNGPQIAGNWAYISPTPVPKNEWSHIAMSRTDGTVRMFLNGVQVGQFDDATNYNDLPTYIGSDGPLGWNQPFQGYIDELRLTTGVGRYTEDFDPPTAPFAQFTEAEPVEPPPAPVPYDAKIGFLSHLDALPVVDERGHTVTVGTGSGPAPTANGKFGAAAWFNGTAVVANGANDDLTVGGSDYTIECFVFYNGGAATPANEWHTIATNAHQPSDAYGSFNGFYLGLDPAGVLKGFEGGGGNSWDIGNRGGSTPIPRGRWVHIAQSRNAGVTRMFVDGVKQDQWNSSINLKNPSQVLAIGGRRIGSWYQLANMGIDEVRFVKSGVYTENFVPPAAPFGKTIDAPEIVPGPPPAPPVDYDADTSNISLLMHADADANDYSRFRVQGSLAAPAALSADQKRFGSASLFTGNGGYASFPNMAGYSFGTDDFTVEAWIHPLTLTGSGTSPNSTIVFGSGANPDGGGANGWHFLMSPAGELVFQNATEGGPRIFSIRTEGAGITANAWHHVAASRNNGVVTLYVNGEQYPTVFAAGSSAAHSVLTDGPLRIGRLFTSSSYDWRFNGYIDEVRITKGVGRYTQRFAVPTAAFADYVSPYNADVKFLSHFDALPVVDELGHTVTNVGAGPAATANGKFGAAVWYRDVGTMVAAPNDDFTIGTGDYTVEGFVFHTGQAPIGSSPYHNLVTTSHIENFNGFQVVVNAAGHLVVVEGNGSSWVSGEMVAGSALPQNQWVHFALSRKAGISRLYMNGVQQVQWNSTTSLPNPRKVLVIGCRHVGGSWQQLANLGLDEIRFSKRGIYDANFVPPAAPFGFAIEPPKLADPYAANVSLLMNFDGNTNDAKGHTVQNSNVALRSDVAKFGSSAYFNRNANTFLFSPSHADFGFGTGDFTVEFWLNRASNENGLITSMRDPAANRWDNMIAVTDNKIGFSNGQAWVMAPTILPTNQWVHIAVARQAGTCRIFVDGNLAHSFALPNDLSATRPLYVGKTEDSWADSLLNGFLDDLRITKGVARYTASFTPPAAALAL